MALNAHFCGFCENALFHSSGDIRTDHPSFLDELSIDKRDSDGVFARKLVCTCSGNSYNSTDSSPVIVDYQLGLCVLNLLIWHIHSTVLLQSCNHLTFLWLL